MKKRIIPALLTAIICSCNPLPLYYSGKSIGIEMDTQIVSSGYVQVGFNPTAPAYYLCGIDKAKNCQDLLQDEEYFMSVVLDSSLVEYAKWRHEHILEQEQYISDYASHSLCYGECTLRKYLLEPDTDYIIYSFVVDPDEKKADGNLFIDKIHTTAESLFKDIRFHYKISAGWEYIYPLNKNDGSIAPNIPWVSGIVDSLYLREYGFDAPGDYFTDEFTKLSEDRLNVRMGIHVIDNSSKITSGEESILDIGHTYYRAMTLIDGRLNDCYDVYRFRWFGTGTLMDFMDPDSTGGEW